MSSTNEENAIISSGNDAFSLADLNALLQDDSKSLVPGVSVSDVSFKNDSKDPSTQASDEDWENFWNNVSKVDAPTTFLYEEPETRSTALTVIAAITLAIDIAERLWRFFSGFDDKDGREQWTQQVIRDARAAAPNFNYVIVYTRHRTNFDGVRDRDWSVRTYRYNLRIGSITYTLYTFRSGLFELLGDGGFLNWAFGGNVISRDPDSVRPRRILFGQPRS